MHRYDDYDNSFSSLNSSVAVGSSPNLEASWNNIRGGNRNQCKSCTCCSRCGKKRLTEVSNKSSSSRSRGNHVHHPEPILPLNSSILNRSTARSNGYNHR